MTFGRTHGGARKRMAAETRRQIGELLDAGVAIVEIARRTGIEARKIQEMKGNGTGVISSARKICYAEGCTNPPVAGNFYAKHELAKVPAEKLARMMAGKA